MFYFVALMINCKLTFPTATSFVALRTGIPFAPCDGFGFCERKDDGGVMFGDTMEGHLFPPWIWIELNGTRYNTADLSLFEDRAYFTLLQVGDIVVYHGESIPVLRSGMLSTIVEYKMWTKSGKCYRYIWERKGSLEPNLLGYLMVPAPDQDQDTHFEREAWHKIYCSQEFQQLCAYT